MQANGAPCLALGGRHAHSRLLVTPLDRRGVPRRLEGIQRAACARTTRTWRRARARELSVPRRSRTRSAPGVYECRDAIGESELTAQANGAT